MTIAIVQDDFSPMYAGNTQKPFAPVFAYADKSPFNLAGATFSMRMQEIYLGIVKLCDPTQWTIDDAANGKAHYQWQPADVNAPGTWQLFMRIFIAGSPVDCDDKELVILPSPFAVTRTISLTASFM
jgi:hypothetical protein